MVVHHSAVTAYDLVGPVVYGAMGRPVGGLWGAVLEPVSATERVFLQRGAGTGTVVTSSFGPRRLRTQ